MYNCGSRDETENSHKHPAVQNIILKLKLVLVTNVPNDFPQNQSVRTDKSSTPAPKWEGSEPFQTAAVGSPIRAILSKMLRASGLTLPDSTPCFCQCVSWCTRGAHNSHLFQCSHHVDVFRRRDEDTLNLLRLPVRCLRHQILSHCRQQRHESIPLHPSLSLRDTMDCLPIRLPIKARKNVHKVRTKRNAAPLHRHSATPLTLLPAK